MATNKANTERPGAQEGASIVELAGAIAKQANSIHEYLQKLGTHDDFVVGSSVNPPETLDYVQLRNQLTSSLENLQYLIDGPQVYLRSLICSGNDLAAMQVGFDFNFFTIVPESGDIDISELAQKAGIDVDRASRSLRMMITRNLFQEVTPGRVSHTHGSRILHRDENLRSAGHYMLDEMWRAATASSDCIKASPSESDSTHSPFHTHYGMPLFAFYEKNPQYAQRFAKAMIGVKRVDRQIAELQENYPWRELEGKVVDVGGGSGHVSVALAQHFPHLSFTIQDASPYMIAQGQSLDLGDAQGRVSWMQHDFFQPQPVKDASAFVIRQCLHNWCDRDVITIFRSMLPGLEASAPGTPLLINDTLLPEPNQVPMHVERSMRQMDLLMFVAVGSKERTLEDFRKLLKEADDRYEITRVLAEGSMGLIEVHLRR